MWEKLLLNLAMMLIEKLIEYATQEVAKLQDQSEKDAINKENQELYQNAETRLEKIKNAKNLLNGTRS